MYMSSLQEVDDEETREIKEIMGTEFDISSIQGDENNKELNICPKKSNKQRTEYDIGLIYYSLPCHPSR